MIDLELNARLFRDQIMKIQRGGLVDFMAYLETTDFFTAPASSKAIYHGCYPGGLCEHTLDVMRLLMGFYNVCKKINPASIKDITMENVVIASAFHDLCKVNMYTKKIDKKGGEMKEYDAKDSGARIGHGEKSILVCLQNGLHLENCEIEAIRWHMGAYDVGTTGYPSQIPFQQSFKENPLARLLHLADQASLLFND